MFDRRTWRPFLVVTLIMSLSLGSRGDEVGGASFSAGTQPSSMSMSTHQPQQHETDANHGDETCPHGEAWCSSLAESEAMALDAIRHLHRQLDDDKNGNIDLAESDEFLREELKYEKNIENRQKAFHNNDDTQVSVRELWETWRRSEVHNWTVEQTIDWLITSVGLPQYGEKFKTNHVNGTLLPILAVNHNNFLMTNLGLKDSISRQKVAVKAMDVVLFGPPRDTSNRVKDFILTTLLAMTVVALYLVYRRYQLAQIDITYMSRHMAEAEEALANLQREAEKARSDERKRDNLVERDRSIVGDEPEEMDRLREENAVLRTELQRAEVELQDKCWVPPPALQHWLQYTYELELKTYNKKKSGAEKQLKQAKDACDKLRKKRSSIMGAFVTTHGRSIDDVDKAIIEARSALTEITTELQERMYRWKQIEILIGCSVINNPGMSYLESLLRVYGKPQSYTTGPGSVISNSQDDIDDDASSIYSPSAVHKLVGASTYMMFPGHHSLSYYPTPGTTRGLNFPPSPNDYSSLSSNNASGFAYFGASNRLPQNESTSGDMTPPLRGPGFRASNELVSIFEDSASGPPTMSQMALAKSKSASSMLNLREQRGMSRESSSKDSSNGEEEVVLDPSDITNSRRVTFRSDHRNRMKAYANGRTNGSLFDSMDNEEARRVVTKALSQTHSLDSIASRSKSEEGAKEGNEEETELQLNHLYSLNNETQLSPDVIQNDLNSNSVPLKLTIVTETGLISEGMKNGVIIGVKNGDAKNNSLSPTTPSPVLYEQGNLPAYPSHKEKGKIWSTLSRLMHPNMLKGESKSSSMKEKKSVSKTEVRNEDNKKTGTNKKSNRISGIFSSLRRHDKTSDFHNLTAVET